MNLFKLLLIGAAVWIIWRLVRSFRVHIERVPPPPSQTYEPMAQCAKCGTHLPANALSSSGRCGRCSE